jgi:hypothetical protein
LYAFYEWLIINNLSAMAAVGGVGFALAAGEATKAKCLCCLDIKEHAALSPEIFCREIRT